MSLKTFLDMGQLFSSITKQKYAFHNIDKIELTVHTSCYWVLDVLSVKKYFVCTNIISFSLADFSYENKIPYQEKF